MFGQEIISIHAMRNFKMGGKVNMKLKDLYNYRDISDKGFPIGYASPEQRLKEAKEYRDSSSKQLFDKYGESKKEEDIEACKLMKVVNELLDNSPYFCVNIIYKQPDLEDIDYGAYCEHICGYDEIIVEFEEVKSGYVPKKAYTLRTKDKKELYNLLGIAL